MAEFVWKKKQTQNLVSNILLKTTFNKEKKLLCLCLKLEFVKWRAIYDGVGDVILGGAFFFKLFPKNSARKRIQFYLLELPWILDILYIYIYIYIYYIYVIMVLHRHILK